MENHANNLTVCSGPNRETMKRFIQVTHLSVFIKTHDEEELREGLERRPAAAAHWLTHWLLFVWVFFACSFLFLSCSHDCNTETQSSSFFLSCIWVFIWLKMSRNVGEWGHTGDRETPSNGSHHWNAGARELMGNTNADAGEQEGEKREREIINPCTGEEKFGIKHAKDWTVFVLFEHQTQCSSCCYFVPESSNKQICFF